LAIVLVPAFGTADYLMYSAHFRALMTMRMVSALISAGLLALLRTRFGRHRPVWIAVVLVLQVGLAIAIFPVYLTGTDTPHYVGTALLLVSVTALLPWTANQVAMLGALLTAMFVAAGVLHGRVESVLAFITQVSTILVSGVLSVIISLLAERTRQREFNAQRDLRAATREQGRLIQHLERVSARLATANEDLQERQRETNDFLYVLSHDLRAPLINIQGFGKRLDGDMGGLEAALESHAAEESVRRLGRMRQSLQFLDAGTAKIDQLISRLLELARLTTRPGRQEWIDANRMVQDVFDACAFQLQTKGIEASAGELPRVWGDPVQLSQVFTNLVDNAIKYMGEGRRGQIAITSSIDGERYRFAVSDTGMGIAPRDRDRVFRLFARAAANGIAGEGVGLATVRVIVNRHGGRIWVDSVPGRGSTFYFTLPRQAAEATTPASPATRCTTPASPKEDGVMYV
jgi:signal transduction histidine kinase